MSENQGYVASNYDVRVTRQGSLSTGKKRYVWVDLNGAVPSPVYVPKGGLIQNVGKYGGKFFQGDLCQYSTDGKCYVLKTFVVAKAVTALDTTILLKRDEFLHIPNVGDILMKAPSTLAGTGTGVAIGAPTATTATIDGKTVDVWSITITANDFGVLAAGDILVEATAVGASKGMLVSNPNTFVDNDIVMNYSPATGDTDFDGARYVFTPVLHGIAWKERMSPLPACVESVNKSLVPTWFEL